MARTYDVRFKAPRKRSRKQAKSGEAIVALMVAGVLMLLGMGAMIAVQSQHSQQPNTNVSSNKI